MYFESFVGFQDALYTCEAGGFKGNNGPSSKLKCRMKGIIELKPEAEHVYTHPCWLN